MVSPTRVKIPLNSQSAESCFDGSDFFSSIFAQKSTETVIQIKVTGSCVSSHFDQQYERHHVTADSACQLIPLGVVHDISNLTAVISYSKLADSGAVRSSK